MTRSLPLHCFQESPHGVFLSGDAGRMEFINPAARRLLGLKGTETGISPCWDLARFQTRGGTPLCGPRCPFRGGFQHGKESRLYTVFRPGPRRGRRKMELLIFNSNTGQRSTCQVLHVLLARPSSREIGLDPPSPMGTPLSRREQQILELMSAGRTTREIARELYISPVTVQNHARKILAKLGVHSRVSAVLAWIEEHAPGSKNT